MTDKEFNNLKPGDKVWVTPYFEGEAVFEATVKSFNETRHPAAQNYIEIKEGDNLYYSENTFKTKVEACEKVVKNRQVALDCRKMAVGSAEAALEEAKKELFKAKKEEEFFNERFWTIDFPVAGLPHHEPTVVHKKRIDFGADPGYFDTYATESKAYIALADYYRGKFKEALRKSVETDSEETK